MLPKLIHQERALVVLSVFSVGLLVFRIFLLRDMACFGELGCTAFRYLFLPWNLALAWIPLVFIHWLKQQEHSKFITGLTLVLWLLFFPNAPYLVTDLIHLSARPPIPIWYDALLLFSFAWLGIALALRALQQLQIYLETCYPNPWIKLLIGIPLLLSGLGIYLGRVQRWNSWDAILHPWGPVRDTLNLFLHPGQHVQAWAMIVLFSLFLGLVFWNKDHFQLFQNNEGG